MKNRIIDNEILEGAFWVCLECGEKYGRGRKTAVSTWHEGLCDICDKRKNVTQFRDFGYQKKL